MNVTVPLRRLTSMSYGAALAADVRAEGDVPVMSSGGVTGSHSVANTSAPSIVIGRKGSHGSIWWTDRPAYVIDTAYSIDRRNTKCDLRWLYYVLQSIGLKSVSNDVGVPGLSRDAAYSTAVPAPPGLDRQRRIADFLDDQVARIDNIIAARRKQAALVFDAYQSDLDGLYETNAGTRPLATLTDPRRPIQYGIVLPGPDFPGGVPIVKGGDIASGRLRRGALNRTDPMIEKSYARSRLRTGDLVIAIRGSVGEIDVVPEGLSGANLTQDAARIAPYTCDPNWLRFALITSAVQADIKARVTGAMVTGINIEALRRVGIPVSTRSSQAEVARSAGDLTTHANGVIDQLGRSQHLTYELKRSLITAAVTGGFDVSAADGSQVPV